jgi:hypothetical protein
MTPIDPESFLVFMPLAGVIVLGLILTYTLKLVLDARTRNKLIASNPSEELIRAVLRDETKLRRLALLRWGVVLCCLAGGFGLIEIVGWQSVTPGAIAVLLGATGIGNLAFYAIERKLRQDEPGDPSAKSM